MEDGPPRFRQGSTCPDVLGNSIQEVDNGFAYRTITLYGRPFQDLSASMSICNFPRDLLLPPIEPRNPDHETPAGLHIVGLGSPPFARRY